MSDELKINKDEGARAARLCASGHLRPVPMLGLDWKERDWWAGAESTHTFHCPLSSSAALPQQIR